MRKGVPEPVSAGSTCRGCGVCCDLYGHTLHATGVDLERWREEGRGDLLGRVGPGGELWWAEDGATRLEYCPFFSWEGQEKGVCAVHATKPAECRGYPTTLHGRRCLMGVQFPTAPGESSETGSRPP